MKTFSLVGIVSLIWLLSFAFFTTAANAEVVQGKKAHASTHKTAVTFAQGNARTAAINQCKGRGGAKSIVSENPICYQGKQFGIDGWWCTANAYFECRK